MKVFVVAVALTIGFAQPALAGKCDSRAWAALDKAGVTDARLVAVDQLKGKNGPVRMYHYWFRVAACQKGYVVVNVHGTCQVADVYERDGCDVATLGDQDEM